MKKILIFFLGIVIPLISEAENTLSITNTTVESNKGFDLDINLKNTDNISALQFDVNLDLTQFSLAEESSLVESRTDDHQLSVSQVSNTKIRVLLFSSTNKNLVTGDGKLVSLSLKSKSEPTSYSVSFSDIIGSNADGETVEVGSSSGSITLKAPKMIIYRSSINFDRVPLGVTKQMSFSINNQGNDDLEVTGLKNAISPFEIGTDFPFTISAGSSKSISISFKSETKGTYSTTLKLNSNEPEPNRANHKVSISAISYTVNELRIGNFNGYSNKPIEIIVKVNNMEKFTGFQFDLNLPNGFEYVSGSEKYLGREDDHLLGVAASTNKVTFIGYSSSNKNFTGEDGNLFSFNIIGNIQYGYYGLNMNNVILTDSTTQNILSDYYNGSVQIASPRIGFNNTNINFGDVDITENPTSSIQIRNYGNDTLKINSANFESNEITWDINVPFNLLNYESVDGTFTFKPSKNGPFSTKLEIKHNDPDRVSKINFSANVFSPNYFYIDNKTAKIGENIIMPFKLRNYDEVTGFQFDIEEPDKLTFDLTKLTLSSRKSDHIITYSKIGDRKYRIICYSPTSKIFSGDDGEIIYIPIDINTNITPRTINFNISNEIISDITMSNVLSPVFNNGNLIIEKNIIPVATNDSYTIGEDQKLDIDINSGTLSNDTDANGDDLTAILVSDVSNGTLTFNSDGSFSYTPNADYYGSDSFTYKANDGIDDSNTATVTITVTAVNDAPLSEDISLTTLEDTDKEITLKATDVDQDNITYSVVNEPSNGTVTISGSTATYTPSDNYNGSDSFTYKANDGTDDSNTATVTITVTAVNDAPVSEDISVTTLEDTEKQITLKATDVEGSDLTYSIVSEPENGTVTQDGKNIVYSPNGDYNGSDSFTYKANDGTDDGNTATVTITVLAVDAPVATNDSYTIGEDQKLDIDINSGTLSNDTDANGDDLTAILVSDVSNGTLTFNSDGSFSYTPNADYYGSDSFTYKANDGIDDSNTATVTITVTAVNDAPLSEDISLTTLEDTDKEITLKATDVDQDNITYSVVNEPSNGTVTISGSTATYTPSDNYNGSDSFTYKANDGTDDSNTATVTITVTAVNDAPVSEDISVTTLEDTEKQITLKATDVEGSELTFIIVDQPSDGTVTISGSTATYTPSDNYNGSDSFTYKANDGTDDGNTATVTITVTAVNDAPLSEDISLTTLEDTDKEITLKATDVDQDNITYSVVNEPSNGTVTISGSTATYTPSDNYNGSDSFTYKANDGTDDSNTATVSVTVTPVNDAPLSEDISITTDEDTGKEITLKATDVEGSELTFIIVDQPSDGTVTISGSTATYTPSDNYNGSDSFTYKANDGIDDSNTATVTITVTAVNDAPLSEDISLTTLEDTDKEITLKATDVDQDNITYSVVNEPSNGTVTISGSAATYTPSDNYNGSDSFTYKANDGTDDSNTATVSVTVTPVNDAPVFNQPNLSLSVSEADSVNTEISQVLASDLESDKLTYAIGTDDTPFGVIDSSGVIVLKSVVDFETKDSYTFTLLVTDGILTDTSNILISVIDELPSISISPENIDFGITDVGNEYKKNISILNGGKDTLFISDIQTNLSSAMSTSIIEGDFILAGSGKSYQIIYKPTDILKEEGFFNIKNNSNVNNKKIYVSSDVLADNFILSKFINPFPSEKDTLEFILKNPNSVIGFQLDIGISDGIKYNTDEIYLSDRKSDHVISSTIIDDNQIRIISYSLSSSAYAGEDGILFYLPIEIPDTLKPEVFTLSVIKTVISSISGTNIANNLSTIGTIKVGNFNPNAINDSYLVDEDILLEINDNNGVLQNDSDIENNDITAKLSSDVSNGTLTLNSNGSFEYTPNENYFGTDSFTYTASDEFGDSEEATVNLTVNPINDKPTALDDIFTTSEDTNLNITNGVLSNDNDVDNDTLSAILVSITSNGILDFKSDGTFQYTPNKNYNGNDSFTYTANDKSLKSDTATVTIAITAVNDAPVSQDISSTTDEDTSKEITLKATDVEGSDMTYSIVSEPSNGTVTISGSTATYTPSDNYNGSDSFTYKANDGTDGSNIATVTITVTAVNDAPITLPDFYTTQENSPITVFTNVGILSNDYDIEDQELTIILIENVSYGSLNLESDGSFTYTPESDFFGMDKFTYVVFDGLNLSKSTTVTIDVKEINKSPVTSNIEISTNEDIPVEFKLLGSDDNNDVLSFVISLNPSNGTINLNNDSIKYVPDNNYFGTDSIRYFADDGRGGISNVSTVTLTVTAVNDAPVSEDISITTDEDIEKQITLKATDVEGSDLTYSIVSEPSNGTVTLTESTATYIPSDNYNGSDSFTYKANDGTDDSNTAKVTIEVDSVYDIPSLSIILTETEINENGGSTKLIATLEGVDAGDKEVSFTLSLSGTASSEDFSISDTDIIIPKISTESEIIINSKDDEIYEEIETITITVGNIVNANYLGLDNFEIIIIDDDTPLGVENEYLIKNIYPNPISEKVTIDLHHTRKIKEVRLHDFNGKIIKSFRGNNSSSIRLPLHDLSNGIFLFKIKTNFEIIIKKIIITNK